MHQCLRDNLQKITDGCRKEELKLNIIQSRDVRLRPKLNKACSEEIAVYCKDVEKGMALLYAFAALHAPVFNKEGSSVCWSCDLKRS